MPQLRHEFFGLPPEAQPLLESTLVSDPTSRPPDQLWILAATLYEPRDVPLLGGGMKHIEAANGQVRMFTVASSDAAMLWSSFVLVRRVRNFLTAVAGVQVPFCHVEVYADRVFTGSSNEDSYVYCPMDLMLKDNRLAEWQERLEKTPAIADKLLNGIPMGSSEDRAIMLLGDARCNVGSDVEGAFLSSWKALEVVARMDFESARREYAAGKRSAASPYLERQAGDLLSGKTTRVSDLTKVLLSVRNRRPGTDEKFLKEMCELRGVLAHDGANVGHFRRISETFDDLYTIARGVVRSILPPDSLFPSFKED